MIAIDGGDGGGGVLRTALGLSIATGTPVEVDDVRGDRPTSGLKDQHVACVTAARDVADAEVKGGARGSDTVTFSPGRVAGGSVAVDIGTAGSATLVCSTVLPAAAVAERPVTLRVGGGTDVAWSPPADYFSGVTLAALRAHGVVAALDVPKRGFYPAGGGVVRLVVGPSTPAPIALAGRRSIERVRVDAVAAADLAGAEVAEWLSRGVAERLDADDGGIVEAHSARYAETRSIGAVVVVGVDGRVGVDGHVGEEREADGAGVGSGTADALPIAGFSALGERGVPAERVAGNAVEAFSEWRDGPGVVDARLADQLVPFLALAGGAVRTPAVTDHVESAVDVARAFGFDVSIDRSAEPGDGAVVRADPETALVDTYRGSEPCK